jgi:UDP-N-acetylglucosamine--N-acetylmuramyl-(pentapeptide) pyrophosphoryl-undecaprenol N-acetylglucosamine transferase
MHGSGTKPAVAIACGGTGGHLFPGLAVAEKLLAKDCAVTLLISPKEVDQQAVKNLRGMEVVTLPAVGLQRRNWFSFLRGSLQSFRLARRIFRSGPPRAALAMGGFTSAPPILAAKLSGARTFLHESNSISGRANRLLAHFVDEAFVGFTRTAESLKVRKITLTGTPVREAFKPGDAAASRRLLGLDPARPTILVMGGSQGASGINDLVIAALPLFAAATPEFQWIHLAGPADREKVRKAYENLKLTAIVHSFFEEMHVALAAASVAVSRAGASSLAELAATLVPAILVPYPSATDNHQFYNAREFVDTDAALLLEQSRATAESLFASISTLVKDQVARQKMQNALAAWRTPHAAEHIADAILKAVGDQATRAHSVGDQPEPRSERDTCGFSLVRQRALR